MIEGLNEWESEEAAKRAADFDRLEADPKFQEKRRREAEKIAAGIGVETPEEAASYAHDEDDA